MQSSGRRVGKLATYESIALCARYVSVRVHCWGALDDPPEDLQALGFVDLDVGREHACAITVERRVYCWPASPTAAPEALVVR